MFTNSCIHGYHNFVIFIMYFLMKTNYLYSEELKGSAVYPPLSFYFPLFQGQDK